MMTMQDQGEGKSKMRKFVTSLVVGAVFGFLASVGLLTLIDSGQLGAFNPSRTFAALVGVMYVLCGLFVGLGTLNPKLGAKFLNVEDADELREQAILLRYSTLGIVGMGTIMILLALAMPLGPVPASGVLAAVIALFVITAFTTRKQFAATDELSRAISQESTSVAFYLMFSVGGLWSILAHLEYVIAPAPLDWMTMFVSSMMIAAFWVCGRKGLLMPR